MRSLHFNEINSTQHHLMENLPRLLDEGDDQIICSTDHQLAGVGRLGRQWDHFENSLAFSFTLRPNPTKTLTSLEVTTHLISFMAEKWQLPLFLKWPNDLLNDQKQKCAGILTSYYSQDLFVIGIGINLFATNNDHPSQDYPTPYNYLFSTPPTSLRLPTPFKKEVPLEIYRYILGQRKSPQKVIENWQSHCLHLNKEVRIVDSGPEIKGKFIGLSGLGEALIKQDNNQPPLAVSAGSLFW